MPLDSEENVENTLFHPKTTRNGTPYEGKPVAHKKKPPLDPMPYRTWVGGETLKTTAFTGPIDTQGVFTDISSHRPAKFGPTTPTSKTPSIAETPKGTQLYRRHFYGLLAVYTNFASPEKDKQTRTHVNNSENEPNIKTQKLHIDTKLLEEVAQQRAACNNIRYPSQNGVMGTSARIEAEDISFPDERWEWLHLIAWRILGPEAQNAGNLVAGTAHANTDMMFIEYQVDAIAKRYGDEGIDLIVTCEMEPNSNIAKRISYTIETPDGREIPFIFDAQSTKKPFICNKDYVELLVKHILDDFPADKTQRRLFSDEITPNMQKRHAPGPDNAPEKHFKPDENRFQDRLENKAGRSFQSFYL